jgi:hypothetical protein
VLQICPGGQALPHVPQFSRFVASNTHERSQAVSSSSQKGTHELAEQYWFKPHLVPHAPQLFGS